MAISGMSLITGLLSPGIIWDEITTNADTTIATNITTVTAIIEICLSTIFNQNF